MRVLSIAARDKRVGGFHLVDQLVGEQKIERAVDGWRAELVAPALELREERIGSCRLVGLQDQLENAPPDRRQPFASEGADPLCACEGDFHLLGRYAQLAPNENPISRRYSVTNIGKARLARCPPMPGGWCGSAEPLRVFGVMRSRSQRDAVAARVEKC